MKTYRDIKIEIIDEEEVKLRKYNYWRGFRACLILVVLPLGIAFVVFCNSLIKLFN